MRKLFILIFFFGGFVLQAQQRDNVDFQESITFLRVSPDGRYLILKDNPVTGFSGTSRNVMVYDLETREVTFAKGVSFFGGFSPNLKYAGYANRFKKGNGKMSFEVRIRELETGKEKSWTNKHFVIAVYDDGKILATKAKVEDYDFLAIKSLNGLYVYDPVSESSSEIISSKTSLGSYFKYDELSADYRFLWKNLIRFEVYDLLGNKKITSYPSWPETGYLGNYTLLSSEGTRAIIRRSKNPEWHDYFCDAVSGKLMPIDDHTKRKLPLKYQMMNGKVYAIESDYKIAERLNLEGDSVSVEKAWGFAGITSYMKGEDYKYLLASEEHLIAVPTKKIANSNMLVLNLSTNQLVDKIKLYQEKQVVKEKPTVSSASSDSKPIQKMYNSTFLSSYPVLSLPWALDYNTLQGRSVKGLPGAEHLANDGSINAIGQIGTTQNGDLILLSLWRGNRNGADVSWFKVSVYDVNGQHKQTENIGVTQKDRAGISVIVAFTVNKVGSTTVINVVQKRGNSSEKFKLVVNAFGNIIRTN